MRLLHAAVWLAALLCAAGTLSPPPPPNALRLSGCATRFGGLVFSALTCAPNDPVSPELECCRSGSTLNQARSPFRLLLTAF